MGAVFKLRLKWNNKDGIFYDDLESELFCLFWSKRIVLSLRLTEQNIFHPGILIQLEEFFYNQQNTASTR